MNTLINLHSRLLGNGFGTIKHSNIQFAAMHVHQTNTEAWNAQHTFRKNTTPLVNHTKLKADANESV